MSPLELMMSAENEFKSRLGLELSLGDEITCPKCSTIVYATIQVARVGEQIKAETFQYPDGRPVEEGAKMECPVCNTWYGSIDSFKKAVTLPY